MSAATALVVAVLTDGTRVTETIHAAPGYRNVYKEGLQQFGASLIGANGKRPELAALVMIEGVYVYDYTGNEALEILGWEG